jgi:hypothetical protein
MSALASQQRALLEALWAPGVAQAKDVLAPVVEAGPLVERGLRAYRSNGRALAVRALAAAYPAVADRLGEENFEPLARQLWLCEPPVCGDVACWGEGLPRFMEGWPELVAAEPAVADLARLEWALHRCATAEDGAQDAASLALLQQPGAEHLRVRLADGTGLQASAWPVVSLWQAHTSGAVTRDAAEHLIAERAAETALVWRDGWAPRARHTAAGEAAFLSEVLAGAALGPALDAAPDFDFNAWLPEAWRSRLLLGVAEARTLENLP